jgi:predicted methyltransferase
MGMLTRTLTLLLSFAITCSSSSAWPQVAGTANEGYKTKEGRERVERGLAGPVRDASQKPEAVVAALELKPGMTVADIGSGVRAQIVTPDGSLVDDFLIVEAPNAVNDLNAPSPAATASIAIGRHIADIAARDV